MSDIEQKVNELQETLLHTMEHLNNLVYDNKQNNISLFARRLVKKFSMENGIFRKGNVLFYLPNYPRDHIQTSIVDCNSFYEQDVLEQVDKYLSDDSVIVDAGANIGSRELYWLTEKKVAYIYAFEVLPECYEILKKNIEINKLSYYATVYNSALYSKECEGKIVKYSTLETNDNVFAEITEDEMQEHRGNTVSLINLDSFDLDKVDLICVDEKQNEIAVLKGAQNTIERFSPLLLISIKKEGEVELFSYLDTIGYEERKNVGNCKYLCSRKDLDN